MKYIAFALLLWGCSTLSVNAQTNNENQPGDTTSVQPYDYIMLTYNGLGRVAIINDGTWEIYVDKFGRKFNFYSELDIALQQLALEGYEYVETFTFNENDFRVILRKKL